jgi:nitric oxide reductase NorE protein
MKDKTVSIFYPPGGLLIWIVIYLELLTFGVAIVAISYFGTKYRVSFHHDSQLLHRGIATVNTLLLLSSGYFAAKGVWNFKQHNNKKAGQLFLWTILLGFGFLALKSIEFYWKIQEGYSMDYSTFFTYYWLLAGFHWVHVLVGLVILFFVRRSMLNKNKEASLEDIEAGVAFWHMCDLIWLLIFPILYLVF